MGRLAVLTCMAVMAIAPAARAAIVPGATVDGPSSDIVAMGNTVQADAAPDGTAAIAYLKNVTAVPHVFVSRLVGGAWTAPEQVDVGLPLASSAPRIGVANGGKVVVTFVNSGQLNAVVKPNTGAPFGSAVPLSIATATYGDVDLAPGGNGYVAIGRNNDVFASRLEGTTFTPVPGPGALGELNSNAAADAGVSDGQARVATTADGGAAVLVWAEGGMGTGTVFARTLTGTTTSPALDAKLPSLDGVPASAQDLLMPDVDMDGVGTAWVVFRQFFNYGANFGRAIARPLPAGGSFGTAQVVDGLASPPTENVEYPRVDVNGAGQGLTANYLGPTSANVESASLTTGTWTRGSLVNSSANTSTAFASPAIAENGSGLISWVNDPDGMGAEVHRILGRTTSGGFGSTLTLSDPTLGDLQQFQIVSAAGDAFAVVGYVQGGPGAGDARRIGGAVVDLSVSGTGGGGGGGATDVTKPKLSKLRLSAKRFRLGRKLASASAVATGTTIRYSLSEAATVTLSFERVTKGRKVGKRCVKPKRGNRRRRACTRYAAVKPALRFANQAAGQRRIRFEGRLSRRKTLKPGVYRLSLTARDTAGNRSAPLKARVTVLPRKRKRG